MPTVTVHNDSFPQDQEFEIPGLGLVVNHQPKQVDATQVAMYQSYGLKFPADGNLILDQNNPYTEPAPEPKEPDEDLDGDGTPESFKEDAPTTPTAVGLAAAPSVDKTKENK